MLITSPPSIQKPSNLWEQLDLGMLKAKLKYSGGIFHTWGARNVWLMNGASLIICLLWQIDENWLLFMGAGCFQADGAWCGVLDHRINHLLEQMQPSTLSAVANMTNQHQFNASLAKIKSGDLRWLWSSTMIGVNGWWRLMQFLH